MAIPTCMMMSFAIGEMPAGMGAEQFGWGAFWFALIFSGGVGLFLSLASLWCVAENGATTYSMTGALNKIPLALIGIVIFAEPVSLQSLVFLIFGLSGGVVFAYVKVTEALQAKSSEEGSIEAAKKNGIASAPRIED